MPCHGRHVGAPSAVPHLRACRLLRRFEEQARHQTFPLQPSPDRDLARTRRGLELVLRRRDRDGARVSGEAAPAGAAPAPSAWSPLQSPLFRNLWIATIVSNVGSWMQDVGAGWLMTELSSSPSMVALVEAADSLAMMLLSLPAGAIADIVDRRRLLIVVQIYLLIVAGVLAV